MYINHSKHAWQWSVNRCKLEKALKTKIMVTQCKYQWLVYVKRYLDFSINTFHRFAGYSFALFMYTECGFKGLVIYSICVKLDVNGYSGSPCEFFRSFYLKEVTSKLSRASLEFSLSFAFR